jgi:hypothetical protein
MSEVCAAEHDGRSAVECQLTRRPLHITPQDHMAYLNKLRRLPDNKVCATCPHEDRMGFKDVCMKFKIFLCSDCKSAHQSFSHRCKVCAPPRPPPACLRPGRAATRASSSLSLALCPSLSPSETEARDGGGLFARPLVFVAARSRSL